MKPFDWFAIGFAAVGVVNLAMLPKKGTRAAALAIVSLLCAAGAYGWERSESALPKWLLATAMGVLLASGLYESARAKAKRK